VLPVEAGIRAGDTTNYSYYQDSRGGGFGGGRVRHYQHSNFLSLRAALDAALPGETIVLDPGE